MSEPETANWARLVPDAEQPWQTLSSRQVLPPPRSMSVDRVRTHAGQELDYTYRPRGPQAVYVLPVTEGGQVALVRQYRYPLRARILELVAGGVEPGETPWQAARRELKEEVGGEASEWLALPGFYPQPSISGVVFFGLIALGVRLGEARPEADELLTRVLLPLDEVYRMLEAGELLSGPCGLTLFQARAELRRGGLVSGG